MTNTTADIVGEDPRIAHLERTKQDTERELSRVADELAHVRETGAAELARASDALASAAAEVDALRAELARQTGIAVDHCARADAAERMVVELRADMQTAIKRCRWDCSEASHCGQCAALLAALSRTEAVAGRWVRVEDSGHTATIACPVKCEGCDVVVPMAGALHTEDPVYLCGKCAAGAVESQMRAERDAAIAARDEAVQMVVELREKADSLRHEVDILTDGDDNPRRHVTYADGRPVVECEWKKPLRAAADTMRAALANTADVAGRWVSVEQYDQMVYMLRVEHDTAVAELVRVTAERDAAIAARDEAVREVMQWTSHFGSIDHAHDAYESRRRQAAAAERARDECEEELGALKEAIAEHLPQYVPENDPDDHCSPVENVEHAGDALKRAERARDIEANRAAEMEAQANREKARADAAERMVVDLGAIIKEAAEDIAREDKRNFADGGPYDTTNVDTTLRRGLAALASTAEVAGRWVAVEEHERMLDGVVQMPTFNMVAAERDAAIERATKAEADNAVLEQVIQSDATQLRAAIAARDEAEARLEALRRALHTVHYAAAADTAADAARIAELHAAERARDEVGIQLAAAQAEIARMRRVVEAARRYNADMDRCGAADPGEWRAALAALDAVPGDALAPVVRGAPFGEAGTGNPDKLPAALEASGIDTDNVKGEE